MNILLVEPSRTGRLLISRMLSSEGYHVECATDGVEALERLATNSSIDVLITSLVLTSMSGLELCWEARLMTQQLRPIYVMALSSSYDERMLVQALDCGADDFIRKPVVLVELTARLRSANRFLEAQKELIRLATFDTLTGVYNRGRIVDKINKNIAERSIPEKRDTPFCVAMLGIDHFKKVNDQYGHDVGDIVLREITKRATQFGYPCGRLGGEEFVLLFDEMAIGDTITTADIIRRVMSGSSIKTPAKKLVITASFGVAQWHVGMTAEQLLKSADLSLYAAKSAGRNRVMASHTWLGQSKAGSPQTAA